MAPWVSASHTSSGTSWSSWAASSERRRMNPTWGPLPWPMATCQPSRMAEAMCTLVSPRAAIWSGTVWWRASLISELPPIATTRVLSPIVRSPWGAAPGPSGHREGHDRLLDVEAILRLVVDDRLRTVDDRIGDLDVPVGRQRVHVDRVRAGQRHAALVGDPVGVARRDRRSLRVVLGHEQGTPALGVDDVRVAHPGVEVVHH